MLAVNEYNENDKLKSRKRNYTFPKHQFYSSESDGDDFTKDRRHKDTPRKKHRKTPSSPPKPLIIPPRPSCKPFSIPRPNVIPSKNPQFRPPPFRPPPRTTFNPSFDDDFAEFLNMIVDPTPSKEKELEKIPPIKLSLSCRNPLCNHKTIEEDSTPAIKTSLTQISKIDDLIELGKTYHCKKNTEHNGLNLRVLCNLVSPLTELRDMIGMKTVKIQIVDQILFFLRGLNKTTKCGICQDCVFSLPCTKTADDMFHTAISGPPGVGKTKLGKIIGKIYKEMGILENGEMKIVSRSDLIGEYLGQTALKTQRMIDSCKGGVLFIDEAYSLGNAEGRDSFSKECIDTINKNLSENRNFLCIIAGYKEQLENCFFKYNEGLNRRFTFRYNIDGYDAQELFDIFYLKTHTDGWKLSYEKFDQASEEYKTEKQKTIDYFISNVSAFPNFGGDIETFFLMCKIVNSRSLTTREPFVFSDDDIKKGMKLYLKNRNVSDSKHMYTVYS